MFIKLSEILKGMDSLTTKPEKYDPFDVFSFHPLQHTGFLEHVWENSRQNRKDPLILDAGTSDPWRDSLIQSLGAQIPSLNTKAGDLNGAVLSGAINTLLHSTERPWRHLIYAYMIENTRIYEICQRLVFELVHGERLGSLSAAGRRWLRATEELFYRDTIPSMISTITSFVRPDARATRRNAYYRMFGMDLNHGTADNRPYPYEKPEAANRDFINTLESLLREVWRGFINFNNTGGPKTTDNAAIADLASRLGEMLRERRTGGNLTREEFVSVAAMSWFHLTVSGPNAPIVKDLKADAETPEERLRRLGERVGIAPHSKARDFFILAEPLSELLIKIEARSFDSPPQAPLLYDPSSLTTPQVLTIINHWSAATGHDLKAVSVSGTGR